MIEIGKERKRQTRERDADRETLGKGDIALTVVLSGNQYFSTQYQKQCFTHANAKNTYNKYGPSTKCQNGKGGVWANDVYRIRCSKYNFMNSIYSYQIIIAKA